MSEYEKQLFLVHMEALHKYRLRSRKKIYGCWLASGISGYLFYSFLHLVKCIAVAWGMWHYIINFFGFLCWINSSSSFGISMRWQFIIFESFDTDGSLVAK